MHPFDCFVFEPNEDKTKCIIRLKVEPYQDVVLVIGQMLQISPDSDHKLRLRFDYDIISVPDEFDHTLVNDEFNQLLAKIILACIDRRNNDD